MKQCYIKEGINKCQQFENNFLVIDKIIMYIKIKIAKKKLNLIIILNNRIKFEIESKWRGGVNEKIKYISRFIIN